MLGGPNQKTYTISGQTTQTSSYWGGTPPDEGLLADLETPKPTPYTEVYVRRGDTNLVDNEIVALCTSDSLGNYSFQLPAGKYCIVSGFKLNLNLNLVQNGGRDVIIDMDCLQKWKTTCDHAIEVKDEAISNLNINQHSHGFPGGGNIPCTYWNGPIPN